MNEESAPETTTRTGKEASPAGSADPFALDPAPAAFPVYFRPLRRERDGIARALAYSRDYLDGCIELISEGKPAPVMMIMEELKRDIISKALIMSRSNIRAAAGLLGIKYTTLYAQVKKFERQLLASRLRGSGRVPPEPVSYRAGPEE